MAEDLGSGVTRTLSALQRQFQLVVWQAGKPPLDSELNLMAQVDWERLREVVRSQMHSGFLLDPTHAVADYGTDPDWSNLFKLGQAATGETEPVLWANVNGWVLPVTGTAVVDGDPTNQVNLYPPPSSDTRIDFVFLEAWATVVAPNPSEANKPSASTVWKYGNVEFGGTNITDDIEDPTIGFETSERVQVQYRLRVVGSGSGLGASVDLAEYPDGLGDPNILGQGTATSPVSGFAFSNMRETLDDPTLWRAGDGSASNSLGTVDGYTYAIPVCALFRRNSNPFAAVGSGGNANQNGAFDRNPSAATLSNPREGAKVLTNPTLTNDLDASSVGTIQITNLAGSGIDDVLHPVASLFLEIGGEIIDISAVSTATIPGTVTIPLTGRGRNGTMAHPHVAGTAVRIFNSRPDGKFADEIHPDDILDLRRAVTLGDWDYQRLLVHNLTKLITGDLHSSYKQAAVSDTQGPTVVEVSYLLADGAVSPPLQTEALDGPDGIRTTFSDAATLQTGVTVMCDQAAPQTAGFVNSFDATVQWDVGADFKPAGFMTQSGAFGEGSTLFLYIGGDSGTEGARATFRDGGERAVRFVSPQEYWLSDDPNPGDGLQGPVSARFIDEPAHIRGMAWTDTTTQRPGPYKPLRSANFERPFIVLGGILNTESQGGGVVVANNSPGVGEFEVQLPGLDFDAAGDWYSKSGAVFTNDPSAITKPVLRGERTLFDMLTAGGTDRTGASSEVYLLLFGDADGGASVSNNGAFQVIGAGATAGYTTQAASAADRVRVRPLVQGFTAFNVPGSASLAWELRSQTTNAEDGQGFASGTSALAISFTDMTMDPWAAVTAPAASKLILNLTLQYHPGRSGLARVPDNLWRVAAVQAPTTFLHQSPASIDTTFPGAANVPDNETYFQPAHIQTWNRIYGLGQESRDLPDAGGRVRMSSEIDRETECFFDSGSKTLVFRPFQQRNMTLHSQTVLGAGRLMGPINYPGPTPPASTPKDMAGLFTTNNTLAYEVPAEYMPRFGRQDIPYYVDQAPYGTGTFLAGINHLFTDTTDPTNPQYNIIGGQDNTSGGNLVSSLFIQTGTTSGVPYGVYSTIVGPNTPAYQGRLVSDPTVISSDLGRGLRAIELPPFLGIARLYGVYDRADFLDKGGNTFQTDRITPQGNAATNLLRTDASKQTLFIREGGAADATGSAQDHTYAIPEDALDITLSPFYVAGQAFEDLEYVVECVVFGFGRGFISQNNFVMARKHTGAGATVLDTDVIELEGASMVIPAAAPLNQPVYAGYTRTPYQGDPYMTQAGGVRTVTDFVTRYGQVPNNSSVELATPIQQFDSSGATIPETPNARALQVLAALDFYTTLGSGKVGGAMFPGTPLDAGFTDPRFSTRIPASGTTPAARVLTRAFSEGQRNNTTRASMQVVITDWSVITAGVALRVQLTDGTSVFLTEGVEWAVAATNAGTATSIADAINLPANGLNGTVQATTEGSDVVTIQAVPVGAVGNTIFIELATPGVRVDLPQAADVTGQATGGFLAGGVDLAVNGGNGTSQLNLTGMTERLPLGILLQDSDFLCEDPLGSGTSAMGTSPSGIQPVQSILGLTGEADTEYTRFLGGPGQWVGMADGGILRYAAYDSATAPTGSKRYRMYRGASAWVLTPPEPGGPIDWVAGSFQRNLTPVLKGGVLVCKALLVRNFREVALDTNTETTTGDEIQMVVLTQGILGDGNSQTAGVELSGIIGPTGFGEGYAAADRYRLEGKPMVSGKVRQAESLDVNLALFVEG
jgi:hypothetical protein